MSNIKTYTNDGAHDNVSQGRVTLSNLEGQGFESVKMSLTSKAGSPGPHRSG